MNYKMHGVFCLVLMFFANVIGVLAIVRESLYMGLAYIAIILIASAVIIYAYCTKCVCRLDSCGHVFPGKLTKFFPERTPGKYTIWDMLGVIIPLLAMLLFPQFWLWQNKVFLALFWGAFVIGGFDAMNYVCKNCGNVYCLMCPKKEVVP